MVLDFTGSVEGGTGCYLVVLGHCRMIYDGAVLVQGGTGLYLMVLGQ